jgi:CDP-diacylglycerol---serine O-phosphatidyltransferase
MLREFSLADLVTLANGSAGMGSILASIAYLDTKERWLLWLAFGLLPFALVFDYADGKIARWRRKHSPLGAQLDSLADLVSFGVAPAVLGFAMGMRGGLDALVLVYFVCSGISRLARYNVTAQELSDESGKVKYFEGTPIPTSLLLVAILAVLLALGKSHADLPFGAYRIGYELHPLVLMYFVSGSAMMSKTLRLPKI